MKKPILSGALALLLAMPAFAGDIMIHDAYARAATPAAKTGAAFMEIMNHSATDDRLIAARSDVAARVELHSHIDAGNGVMQMREAEDGFTIPAGGMHALARGGDHVMLMGLNQSFVHGETISVTLVFEEAGEIEVEIGIDLERMPEEGSDHGHHHSN